MAERRGGIYARFDGRANCRKSERKPRRGYVKGIPGSKIHHFHVGNKNGKFNTEFSMTTEDDVQIKHTALEAARVAAGKTLTNKLGDQNYHLHILVYPHHVLRENSMATGAGADRFSAGMSHSFGSPLGYAARAKRGTKIISLYTNKENGEVAKDALRRAKMKFPMHCSMKEEPVAVKVIKAQ